MQVAILAGGLATRLGNLTRKEPKLMLSIRGKTFLEYQLEFLKKSGIKDIVLCLGHMGDRIEQHFGNGEDYGVKILYSFEDRPLGTAGALKHAEALLSNTFFTLYGDSYLFLDFNRAFSCLESHNRLALMTVYKNHDHFDKSNTVIEGNLVRRYSKKEKTKDTVYIDYGANAFRKEVLKLIPQNQFYDLEELFPRLIDMQELLAFEVKKRFYEIGSPQGLKEFERYIAGRKN